VPYPGRAEPEPDEEGIFAMKRWRFLSPALALFFLSPVIGELLCGSAPPAEFFQPIGFIMLAVLYGGGAILARELTHRWDKGCPTLLVLGAAYGVAEEGLMCKSFFDPAWMDLGPLASYGRWVCVNWVWAAELTTYHAVFSIAIPILLVDLMFPMQRQRMWVSPRKLCGLFFLWLVNGILIFLFISPYRPPGLHYLLTMMAVAGLCLLAWRLPHPMVACTERSKKLAHPIWFLLVGFVGTLALFFLVWVVPPTGIHPLLTMGLMVCLVIFVGWIVWRLSGNGTLSQKQKLALSSGALGFFILLAPLQEFDRNRTDNTKGMTFVGLAILIFLVWMARRLEHLIDPCFSRGAD